MREPANASATRAGTCAFIAQVRSSWPEEPKLRPAMNTTLAEFRHRLDLLAVEEVGLDAFDTGSREFSRRPFSLKRATPTTRLPGAARLASCASDGPIFPPTPRTMRSPGRFSSAAIRAARRAGHHLHEVLHVAEAVRQRGGFADPRSLSSIDLG